MRASLNHVTLYEYDRPVALGPQTVRLKPLPHCPSPTLFYALTVEPGQHHTQWMRDAHGNDVALVQFDHKVRRFGTTIDLVVALKQPFLVTGQDLPDAVPPGEELAADRHAYQQLEGDGRGLHHYLSGILSDTLPHINEVKWIAEAVHRDIRYQTRDEPGVQAPWQTLQLRSGSCRDSSWLLVQLLRYRGYLARFVSGYLIEPPSGDGPTLLQEATELHAWCEVLIPHLGWIGLDPTSGHFAGSGHIPLAAGPHHQDTAPLSGTLEHCEAQLSFSMSVRLIH